MWDDPETLVPAVHAQDHTLGPVDAPVTLVEYGDFECPHCAGASAIVAAVRQRLGNRLRFVFRNFPIAAAHPHAVRAAEAAESVAAHAGPDAYWAMHRALFAHQRDAADALDDAHLVRYAAAAGADARRVASELAAGTYEALLRSDFVSGQRSGVRGTPTFFINGVRYGGDWRDVDAFTVALVSAARREAQHRRAARSARVPP